MFGSSFRQHRTKGEGKGKVTVEIMAAEITVPLAHLYVCDTCTVF